MEEFILKYADTKLAVVIATGILVLIIVCTIFGKTSLGKKQHKFLTKRIDNAAAESVQTSADIKEYQTKQEKTLQEERDFYKDELAVVESKRKELEEFVVASLKHINNVKVKELISKYAHKDTENIDTKEILEEIDKVAETSEKGVNNGKEE